jgi:hypothetical protein
MSQQAIGTYLKLLYRDGSATGYYFQNFAAGETVSYESQSWVFAGFGFSGGSFDASASSLSASLLLGLNQLDANVFQQAANERWLAEVKTVWLNNDTFAPEEDWTADIYEVLGVSHDNSRLSVRLGSPLDAVLENAPRLRLTQKMVGSLPASGFIPLN